MGPGFESQRDHFLKFFLTHYPANQRFAGFFVLGTSGYSLFSSFFVGFRRFLLHQCFTVLYLFRQLTKFSDERNDHFLSLHREKRQKRQSADLPLFLLLLSLIFHSKSSFNNKCYYAYFHIMPHRHTLILKTKIYIGRSITKQRIIR